MWNDKLGDHMKRYENITRDYLPNRMPVRHGQWLDGGCYNTCSICNADFDRYDNGGYLQDFDYCPSCGAKMDLKE